MGSRQIELEMALEKTVLEIIHNRHYGNPGDPNGDAQAEYLSDSLGDICRALYGVQEPAQAATVEVPKDLWVEGVRQFMLTYGHEIRPAPVTSMAELPIETIRLRNKLIIDEVKEMFDAIADDNVVEVFDALLDLTYVTIGAMMAYGFPAEKGFAEVQRSNMTKLGEDGQPIYDEDGKVVKGPNFEPPQLAPIMEEARR